MNNKRRQLGMVLFLISALSFLVARMASSRPLISGLWWSGNVGGFSVDVGGGLGWLFLAPIILFGTVGLVCIAWPSRKPPKLPKLDQ